MKRKLHLISEDLGRLVIFRDEPFEGIVDDFVKLATVERLLERIVMRAIDINQHLISEMSSGGEEQITRLTYRETFLRLADFGIYSADFGEWIAGSAGLRNILVHDYNDVDRKIVFASIRTCLDQYHQYVKHIDAAIRGTNDTGSPPSRG